MGKWGFEQDETFIVTTLTDDFADNLRIANVPSVIQAFVYILYTKGNETTFEIRIEESRIDDDNPTTENYYHETIVDNEGNVEKFIFKLSESGNYRIPLEVGESEDRLRVAVRGAGTPPFTGTAMVLFGIR